MASCAVPLLKPHASTKHPELVEALTHTLCFGEAPPSNTPFVEVHADANTGFFSQLNQLAQQLVERVYDGIGVPGGDLDSHLYAHPVRSYGDGKVGDLFSQIFLCPPSAAVEATRSACRHQLGEWASSSLRRAPRYLLVSHLLALLLSPHHHREHLHAAHEVLFDVAIHARRRDKQAVVASSAHSERIGMPDADLLVQQAFELLRCVGGGAGARATSIGQPPRILITSDDEAFEAELTLALTARGALVERTGGEAPNTTDVHDPVSSVCGASCVPPLLDAVRGFTRAHSMVVSLGSNMGGYLLSNWAAANGDSIPRFIDVDQRVHRPHLAEGGLYFCDLAWGSRHGLCRSPLAELERSPAVAAAEQQAAANASASATLAVKEVIHAHANKHAMRARTSGSSPSSTTPQDDATEREAMAARFDEIIRSSNEVATPPSAGQFLVLGGVGMDRFLLNKASGGHAADASGGAANTAFRVAATDAVAVFRERFVRYQACS